MQLVRVEEVDPNERHFGALVVSVINGTARHQPFIQIQFGPLMFSHFLCLYHGANNFKWKVYLISFYIISLVAPKLLNILESLRRLGL